MYTDIFIDMKFTDKVYFNCENEYSGTMNYFGCELKALYMVNYVINICSRHRWFVPLHVFQTERDLGISLGLSGIKNW